MTPWYDEMTSIAGCACSLEGLNNLMDARHEAGYERGERLQEWVVLGELLLDTCGNTMKMDRKYSNELVLPRRYFSSYTAYMGCDVPETKHRCVHCGKPWSIDDWQSAKRTNRTIDVVGDHVGKTVQQLQDEMNADDSGKSYYIQESIQNDKLIDLRPDPKWDHSKYMKGRPINERGSKYIKRDYVIEEGDRLWATVFEYYHVDCLAKHKADEEFKYFASMFADAGFKCFELHEIANEYCGIPSCCPPWYKVVTEAGEFKIGWRKRVINLVWPNKLNALQLFEDEDVTKGSTYIHAWGTEKATEYLKKIREFALEE